MVRPTNTLLLVTAGILGILYITGQQLNKQKERYEMQMIQFESDASPIRVHHDVSNVSDSIAKAGARMKLRRDTMLSSCVKYGINTTMSSDLIYVKNPYLKASLFYSDKHKLLLCEIPKCGSTNQAKFLITAEGLVDRETLSKISDIRATSIAHRRLSLGKLHNINEVTKRMDTYSKFVLVRDPLSRILSAFRNKLENNTREDGYARLAKHLHMKYGNGNTTDITLDDFITYLTDSKANAQRDQHWNYFNRLCSPCAIKYDYIVHLETLEDDMKFVNEKLGISGASFASSYNSFTDWDKVEKYYSAASPQLVNALYKLYKVDYDLFGYPPPPQF